MTLTTTDLDNAERDLKTVSAVSNSKDPDSGAPIDAYQTRLGDASDTLNGRLKKLGFEPPVAYAGGISFTASDNVKTVEESGFIYAPKPTEIPFATSGTWVGDDDARFYLVQSVLPDNIAPEFSFVADFDNGGSPLTTANGLTIDSSNVDYYVGRKVSTVCNNSTSKKGGSEYVIKTASQAATDGDEVDGYANHYFYNTGYVAVIIAEGLVDVTKFGASDDYDQTTGVITTDSLAAFHACRDYCKRTTGKHRAMFVPGFAYYLSDTFDLTSEALDPELNDRTQGFNLEFENRTTEFLVGTQIFVAGGATGVAMDTSGSDGITTRNVGLRPAVIDGARVGLLQARTAGAGQTLWAGDQKHHDIFINMGSDTSYADDFGTIGFINLGGEESSYENAQIWANTPVIHTSTAGVIKTGGALDNAANPSINIQQFSSKTLDTAASNTVFAWYGLGRLIAYDYVSPCLLINNAATLDMGATFFQKRESNLPGVTLGVNNWAVDCWNCFEYKHFGAVEGSKNYMIQRRAMTGCEVNVVLNEDATVPGDEREAWYLFSDGGGYIFENSEIKIRNNNSSGVLGGKRSDDNLNEELQIIVSNVDIKYSRNYAENPIDPRALRVMDYGCHLRYGDTNFNIPSRGVIETTIFNKNIGKTVDAPMELLGVNYPPYQTNLGSAYVNVLIEGTMSNISTSGGAAAGTADPASRNFSVSANTVRINNAQDIFVPSASPLTATLGDQAVTDIASFNMAACAFTVVDDDSGNKINIFAQSLATGTAAGLNDVYITARIRMMWGGGVEAAPTIEFP